MTRDLQIYDARERALVRAADVALAPLRWLPRAAPRAARRVLLLRLERIGDLLMAIDAIRDARADWPDAQIDLAVGSWNEPIARLIPGVSNVLVADAPWLARGSAASWRRLVATARRWRARRYDLVVNFEPDIRSNLLAWLTGAPARVGYGTGGGGALLTEALAYEPSRHVAVNARTLIAYAAGRVHEPDGHPRASAALTPPADAIARAADLLRHASRPLVGVHASGGRLSKQWHLDRFAAVARRLAAERGATIVLTGSPSDRSMVDEVAAALGGVTMIRADGALDLPSLAALLDQLDVFITSDTGPMHLAAAMQTAVVALFGPSDPKRYGPRAAVERIVRVDLPCSPCGQVRLPPVRCRGHVPDCMDGIGVDVVVARALEILDTRTAAQERA
ncbi:MAG TPA: glycosyltransferase family 9 protein [Vicinamibacterales bacterium]|jgi:ADP-heptose:LPS heptosyltransferase|nr:glycosyltransferase family 9 protein [Vicinamibacterales bacterium]